MKRLMLFIAALMAGTALPVAADVANENFADAIVLEGDKGAVSATNVGATREDDEWRFDFSCYHSIWYRWTASRRGYLTIDTFGSDFDTVLAVFTGTEMGDLVEVDWNDDVPGVQQSRVKFVAERGVTYQILVGGWADNTGNISLNWELVDSSSFELVIEDYVVTGYRGFCPEEIVIPDGVRGIYYDAFNDTYGNKDIPSSTEIVRVTLPESLVYIDVDAFAGCSNLRRINIPANVAGVDYGAFRGCTSLADVTFGREDYMTSYDLSAFKGTPFFESLPFSLKWGETSDREVFVYASIGKCPDELDIEAVIAAEWNANRQRRLEEDGYDIGDVPAISRIEERAFIDCGLKSVIFPAGLSTIERAAFFGCTNLTRIAFRGNAPEVADGAFYVPVKVYDDGGWYKTEAANTNCTVYVSAGSTGWGVDIPGEWLGMRIAYLASSIVEDGVLVSVNMGGGTAFTVPSGVTNIAANAFAGCGALERVTIPDGVVSIDRTAFDECGKLWANWYRAMFAAREADGPSAVALTVTNVVVHYVAQGVPSDAVVPPTTDGIVAVFGEVVAGGTVAIPSTWAEQYPLFAAKFGSDFAKAVTASTGKTDGAGRPMAVWQDFVAGTDPTNPEDTFKASITFDPDTNAPVIGWSPVLPAAEAAKRVYKVYGKARLTDGDWTLVNGDATSYNFFRVTVEMR